MPDKTSDAKGDNKWNEMQFDKLPERPDISSPIRSMTDIQLSDEYMSAQYRRDHDYAWAVAREQIHRNWQNARNVRLL